jgi:hypothetical protein
MRPFRGRVAAALVLVALLAGTTLYLYPERTRTRDPSVVAASRLGELQRALLEFAHRHKALPDEKAGLAALVKDGLVPESSLLDTAGRPYAYRCHSPDCLEASVASSSGPGGRTLSTRVSVRPPSPVRAEMEALQEAAYRDRKQFPEYAGKVLNDAFQERVMARCIGRPHDKTTFMFAFVLDASGAVAQTLLDYETTLGKCLVEGMAGIAFPAPPKAPFVAHYEWIRFD